jgi:hypothetical protein
MYFPRNWEFGSALSKLRNNLGGFEPPKPPSGERQCVWVSWAVFVICGLKLSCVWKPCHAFEYGAKIDDKFCFKAGKIETETLQMVIAAYVDQALSCSNVFWRYGRKDSEDDPSSGRAYRVIVFICQGVIHKEFVSEGEIINALYYKGVMEMFLDRIQHVRPGEWKLVTGSFCMTTPHSLSSFKPNK